MEDDGLLFISTSKHSTPSEGYYQKLDCETFCVRFRREFVQAELTAMLAEMGFRVAKVEQQREKAREHRDWMVFVCEKVP